jgi:carotenoid cleavage dioxygenase-like enzyme
MRDDFRKGFTDQTDEIIAPSLEVEGVIPDWLSGTLLRNGPARFRLEDKTLNHWFDGLAMLHKFDIADGKVGYANKFLDSPAFQAAKDGKMQYGEFATDPCRSLFKRIAQIFTGSTPGANANVSIGKIGRRFVAQTESPMPIAFYKKILETIGRQLWRHAEGPSDNRSSALRSRQPVQLPAQFWAPIHIQRLHVA